MPQLSSLLMRPFCVRSRSVHREVDCILLLLIEKGVLARAQSVVVRIAIGSRTIHFKLRWAPTRHIQSPARNGRLRGPPPTRTQTPHNNSLTIIYIASSRLPLLSRVAPRQAKRVPPPVREAALRRRRGAALGRTCRARSLRGWLAQVRLQQPKEVTQVRASLRTHCDERLRIAKLCGTNSMRG